MTIHSEWVKIFHQECPEAFIDVLDESDHGGMNVGIIDGHLQLMCLHERMGSWDRFIQIMYINPIENLYKMGCNTVVVCFDAYDFVPAYKNMTQIKRTQGKEVCTFAPNQELPHCIPPDTMKYLMNRNFKVKIIQKICEKLPSLVSIEAHQEFIVDYKKIVMYKPNKNIMRSSSIFNQRKSEKFELDPIPLPCTEFESMGESDVKFTRYVSKYGNALVHAIDGDYMVIALLYYSNIGLNQDNKIYLYRQKQKCFDEDESGKNQESTLKKRKNKKTLKPDEDEDEMSDGETFCLKKQNTGHNMKRVPDKLSKKNKCWVDMQLIYVALLEAFRQSLRTDSAIISEGVDIVHQGENGVTFQETERDHMKAITFLILCAGTDFSRNLPLIGPQRLWEHLPYIAQYMIDAVKRNDVSFIGNCVVSKLYKCVFSKHVKCNPSSWLHVYQNLLSSGLSKNTKDKFPKATQLFTTIKNVLWVIQYWDKVNGNVDTPLDGSNGFVLCSSTQKVIFEDTML